jgi:Tol biopolymer transport system component
MPLTSGTKLGPYEIQSAVGAGGMGEVYRARDSRLERTVAIKVIQTHLSTDPALKQRLEREAKAVSRLSHPHICALYDIGYQDGVDFLVMEYLEGETLERRLMKGPLPPDQTVRYAAQIADALAKAHKMGITHRDLKPANIMLTKSGAKLMDFGLAKQSGVTMSAVAAADVTMDQTKLTGEGMIVGTFQYMAPEQLEGKEIDARTDIFTFGEVVYEMATGKPPFSGGSRASLIAAILTVDPPPITQVQPLAPPALDRVVKKCLQKDPDERWQSASDLASELQWITTSSSQSQVAVPLAARTGSRRRTWWPLVAIAGATVVASSAWWLAVRVAQKPQPKFTRLTYLQGYLSNARFAYGGQSAVYSAQWNDDPLQLYSVRMEFPQSTKIDLPPAALLALSPSGEVEVATGAVYHHNFLSGTMGYAQMGGGTPRSQQKDVIAADYAPDGKTLAVVRFADNKVQLEYPTGKVLFSTSGYVDHIRVSPNGKQVAFLEHPVYDDDRGWVSVVDDAGKYQRLTQEYSGARGLAWSRTGNEVWFTAGIHNTEFQLFGVSLSGKLREILNTPGRVRLLDIASDGRVLLAREETRTEMTAIDRATGKERTGLAWFNGSGNPRISPDGQAIVFHEWSGPAGPYYLVGYRKLDGSPPTALGAGADPSFSPDGTFVSADVFSRPPQIVLLPIGAGETRRLSLGDITSLEQSDWFPDGKRLLLRAATEGQPVRTYELTIADGKLQTLGPPDFKGCCVSGDGKRVAGYNLLGQQLIFDIDKQELRPIPGLNSEDSVQQWSEDGQALLVLSGTPWQAQIDRVEVATGKRTTLEKLTLSDKSGSTILHIRYSEKTPTSIYATVRIIGSLYVVEGLE